jgi:hypothetical protein
MGSDHSRRRSRHEDRERRMMTTQQATCGHDRPGNCSMLAKMRGAAPKKLSRGSRHPSRAIVLPAVKGWVLAMPHPQNGSSLSKVGGTDRAAPSTACNRCGLHGRGSGRSGWEGRCDDLLGSAWRSRTSPRKPSGARTAA